MLPELVVREIGPTFPSPLLLLRLTGGLFGGFLLFFLLLFLDLEFPHQFHGLLHAIYLLGTAALAEFVCDDGRNGESTHSPVTGRPDRSETYAEKADR